MELHSNLTLSYSVSLQTSSVVSIASSKNVALSTLHFCRAFPRVRHATIDVDNAEPLEPYPDNTTFSPAVDH